MYTQKKIVINKVHIAAFFAAICTNKVHIAAFLRTSTAIYEKRYLLATITSNDHVHTQKNCY